MAKIYNRADFLILKSLIKAEEKGDVIIYYDYGKLNKVGSPVYNPWENLTPILLPLIVSFCLIFFIGILNSVLLITLSAVYFAKIHNI